ncbi:hypothetical protein X975_06689, partial [Stegodyphus mimosarum]
MYHFNESENDARNSKPSLLERLNTRARLQLLVKNINCLPRTSEKSIDLQNNFKGKKTNPFKFWTINKNKHKS